MSCLSICVHFMFVYVNFNRYHRKRHDKSDEEVARLSNYFDDDDQEKKQIVRQNTLNMLRSKAKVVCLLYLLLKRRRNRLLANNLRPVGRFTIDYHLKYHNYCKSLVLLICR
jgi:hypothetical protein